MKRLAVLLLALGLVTSLAGCGTSSTAGGTSQSGRHKAAPTAKQLFPNGVTIVVGFAPGGAVDTGARLLQPYLQKALGVPVVVQNMSGAGGATASGYVYRQKPDSPVLLMSFLPALSLAQVIGHGNYDMLKFTPLGQVFGHNTAVFIAKKGSKWTSLQSLQDSKTPITAGSAGVGSSATWMAAVFLKAFNHVNIAVVPYKGGSAASNAAIGGSIDLAATTAVEAVRLINAGKAQGVVMFAPKPYSQLPGIASIAQVGDPKEAFESVLGLNGPPNMPADEVAVLTKALQEAAGNPDLSTKSTNAGISVDAQPASVWKQTESASYDQITQQKQFLTSH